MSVFAKERSGITINGRVAPYTRVPRRPTPMIKVTRKMTRNT